ncbi:hypothetical protein D3C86_1499220 [compost metagenome]
MHPRLQQIDATLHRDQIQLVDLPGDGISIQLLQIHETHLTHLASHDPYRDMPRRVKAQATGRTVCLLSREFVASELARGGRYSGPKKRDCLAIQRVQAPSPQGSLSGSVLGQFIQVTHGKR